MNLGELLQNKKVRIGLLSALGALVLTVLIVFLYRQLQFKSYKNFTAGFEIKYPKSWDVGENAHGAIVIFQSPKETAIDDFLENVNISSSDLSMNPVPLAQYAEIASKQLQAVFKQVKVIESKPLTINGTPAHAVLYESPDPDLLRIYVVFAIKHNEAYTFTFISPVHAFEEYFPIAKRMLNSWRLY